VGSSSHARVTRTPAEPRRPAPGSIRRGAPARHRAGMLGEGAEEHRAVDDGGVALDVVERHVGSGAAASSARRRGNAGDKSSASRGVGARLSMFARRRPGLRSRAGAARAAAAPPRGAAGGCEELVESRAQTADSPVSPVRIRTDSLLAARTPCRHRWTRSSPARDDGRRPRTLSTSGRRDHRRRGEDRVHRDGRCSCWPINESVRIRTGENGRVGGLSAGLDQLLTARPPRGGAAARALRQLGFANPGRAAAKWGGESSPPRRASRVLSPTFPRASWPSSPARGPDRRSTRRALHHRRDRSVFFAHPRCMSAVPLLARPLGSEPGAGRRAPPGVRATWRGCWSPPRCASGSPRTWRRIWR